MIDGVEPQNARGIWCLLRIGRRHLVLMRPNFIQLGHLGVEIMMGVRIASRFHAPLWIIRPADVVNSAVYSLQTDPVKIRVIGGRLGSALEWALLPASGPGAPRQTGPLQFYSPLPFFLAKRMSWLTVWLTKPRLAVKANILAGMRAVLHLARAVRQTRKHLVRTCRRKMRSLFRRDIQTVPSAATTQSKGCELSAVRDNNHALTIVEDMTTGSSELGPQPPPVPNLVEVANKRRVNHTYFRRLWLDQVPPFCIPADRVPSLQAHAQQLFGIGPETRLVSLHMREPGFKRGREVHDLKYIRRNDSTRNVALANYFPTVDYLHQQGLLVVRIGDPSMTPIDHPAVIDLATSPHRTDWLELYCVSRSEFFIGCESGAAVLAWMLGKPVVTLNATEPLSGSFPIHASDIFILKRVRDRCAGRLLSPLDMLAAEYLNNARDPHRYEYLDNDPEDILDAVQDMLAALEGGVAPETPEQREFRLRATGIGMRLRLPNGVVRKWGPHEGYMGRGRIAPSFARKYIRPHLAAQQRSRAAAEPFGLAI